MLISKNYTKIVVITVIMVATDCIVLVEIVCFSVRVITHELLHLAQWNFAGTCSLTAARILLIFRVIGQRSRSRALIFGVFTIAKYSKQCLWTITREPLHSAWWNFALTCTSTTSRTLLNFKVIGHRSRSFFVSGPSFPNCFYQTWKNLSC